MKKIASLITIIIFFSCSSKKKEESSNIYKKENPVSKKKLVVTTESIDTKIRKDRDTVYREKIDTLLFEKKDIIKLDTIIPVLKNRDIDEYKKNVNGLFKKRNGIGSFSKIDIKNCIPQNKQEFSVFYDLSYDLEEKQVFFDFLNEKIFQFAKQDERDMIFLVLNLAEFVDGEYAEGYFYNVEEVVLKNKDRFCFYYKHLSEISKKRLEGLYLEICKGVKRQEEDY